MNRFIHLTLGITSLFTIATMPMAMAASKQPVSQDEIILPADSPQLANLKIESVIEVAAPAAEPLNGKISFDENYTARITSPVIGRALQINAQIGDKVKAGQVLMVLDSPDLGSAVADSRKADADLQLKKQALERSRMLLEGGVIAQKEYENSQAEMAEAGAEAQRARARLKNLGSVSSASNNESFTLRAPIGGVIVDRQINPGSEVRPDAPSPLFIITDPSHLWASIDLPERDLNKVTEGQMLSIEVDAYPNESFSGKVQSIGAMVEPTTRRIPVRCIVLEGKGKLKPEMYARITPLSNNNNKVIRLPNSALITEGLYSYVFVEVSPGHIKKRRVTLNTQARDFATVKEGLQVGDRLVTSGAILLNSELSAGK
ncbi:efflux transporter periplasmic adaptor subunit [Methylovorus sp. MM2]|uniref:efflux RND transporter periplasmic adaptor subunit n=1 Tax=Methylovorus sp. MM2 TaxID=1848038 RepID=UPI0007DE80F0|nr:efflux RND transporter periplasmic adaptor subunit [Methylovorus sp. MM2]OAM52755.1 efflux transporter periplasmic adaptor subunit [Methylovorus sp. MM2]